MRFLLRRTLCMQHLLPAMLALCLCDFPAYANAPSNCKAICARAFAACEKLPTKIVRSEFDLIPQEAPAGTPGRPKDAISLMPRTKSRDSVAKAPPDKSKDSRVEFQDVAQGEKPIHVVTITREPNCATHRILCDMVCEDSQ